MKLPSDAVTLMFTDIEGSTRLLAALGQRYMDVLGDHRRILRSAFDAAGGNEVYTQGDAFFVVFEAADRALAAAADIQRRLAAHPWPDGAALRVRIGLHTGAPALGGEGYVGMDLHRGARICAAGHGGQVVLSATTREAIGGALGEGIALRALGAHRLKDIDEALTLFDLEIEGLEDRFPPLRSIGSRPTNLTGEPPELIGREAELAAIAELLGTARLVTLVGPGGTGKTSLAMRLAADLLPGFPDGAFVAHLAPVADAGLVAMATAAAIGLREQTGRTFAEVLGDYLAEREMLLVLDNLEHVIDAAPFVADLLARAPGVRVLVTSRVPLRVREEREFPVPPLSLVPGAGGAAAAPAVALFAERAAAARPGFTLDEATAPAVAEICARLDGLPLAIELAAARVRVMTPQAMLARLERPLELAAGGPRHAPTRQQALRATIEWSHDLLDDRLRRVFSRLGVFGGPFAIEAAEEVCGAGLEDLAALLDHNLLRAHDEGMHVHRLGMLETIRAYAGDRLDASGELDEMRDRHAAWCAALGQAAAPQHWTEAYEGLLPRFTAEQDELRAALDWLIASGQGDAALCLAGDLAPFWDTRGRYAEGRERLEQALAHAVEPGDPDRARALFGLGRMAVMQGDRVRARAALVESLELHRALGDVRGIVVSLTYLGLERSLDPDGQDDALRLMEEMLAIARASGDPWSLALALAVAHHPTLPAREMLEESLLLQRQLTYKSLLAVTLNNAGELAVSEGRTADAAALLEEGLSLAIDLDYEMVIAEARMHLSRIARADGDLARAESLLDDALDRSERAGDPLRRASCLFGLARLAADRGDDTAAQAARDSAERVVSKGGIVLSAFERWDDESLWPSNRVDP